MIPRYSPIIGRQERADAGESFLPPYLESLRELEHATFMVETTDAHEIFVGASVPGFHDYSLSCRNRRLRAQLDIDRKRDESMIIVRPNLP